MSSLTGSSISSTYDRLLALPAGGGDTTNLVALTDGNATTTFALQISSAGIKSTGTLIVAGTSTLTGAVAIAGATTITNTLTIGSDGSGKDVIFYSDTSGDQLLWDSSEKKLVITGTNGANALEIPDGNVSITDDLAVDGTTNLDNTDIDGTFTMDGASCDVNAQISTIDGQGISLDSTVTLNIDNSNTTNGVSIGTATDGGKVFIGHTTSETTVNDNLTVTGQFALINSASPGAHTDNQVFIGAKDSAGTGTDTLATLQLFAEEDVDATAMASDPSSTFTHRFPIWINDTAYWIALDPV